MILPPRASPPFFTDAKASVSQKFTDYLVQNHLGLNLRMEDIHKNSHTWAQPQMAIQYIWDDSGNLHFQIVPQVYLLFPKVENW